MLILIARAFSLKITLVRWRCYFHFQNIPCLMRVLKFEDSSGGVFQSESQVVKDST